MSNAGETLTAREVRMMQPKMAELLQALRRAAAIADDIGPEKLAALHKRGRCDHDEVRELTEEDSLSELARSIGCVMALNGQAVPADDADAKGSDDAGVVALQRIHDAAEAIRDEITHNADAIKAACQVAKQEESAIDNLLTGDGYGEAIDLASACANIIHRHRLMSEAARVKGRAA